LGWADGGGKIKQAPLRSIIGRDAVARFSLGTKRFWPENARVELEEVNGQAALIIRAGDQVFSVLTMDVEDGQIQAIRIIVNPDKLARVLVNRLNVRTQMLDPGPLRRTFIPKI